MRPIYNHVMVDIETLGVNPRAPIISIGACAFCVKSGKIGKTFHRTVEWDITRFQADVSTIRWWIRQAGDVREIILDDNAPPIEEVLSDFSTFIANLQTTRSIPDFFWANTPAFDFIILRNAFGVCRADPPWKFWQERCVRTIRDRIVHNTAPTQAHNALNDAIAQAKDVIRYFHGHR